MQDQNLRLTVTPDLWLHSIIGRDVTVFSKSSLSPLVQWPSKELGVLVNVGVRRMGQPWCFNCLDVCAQKTSLSCLVVRSHTDLLQILMKLPDNLELHGEEWINGAVRKEKSQVAFKKNNNSMQSSYVLVFSMKLCGGSFTSCFKASLPNTHPHTNALTLTPGWVQAGRNFPRCIDLGK